MKKQKLFVGADVSVCPKHQRNTQRGITLIALIITIIVLLILAVVSIRLVMNNGILGKAESGVSKYQEAEADEQAQLLKAEYEMAKYEGKFSGSYTDYVLNKKYGLKIGDYVAYDATKDANGNAIIGYKATYTSYSEDNASSDKNDGRSSGYSDDQVFNLSSYTGGWRVLGIENGQLQLISADMIGPDSGGYTDSTYGNKYYLKGQAGVKDGPGELNAIAGMYGQGKGAESARSVNVDDINKITGYNPERTGDGKPYASGEIYEYGNEVTYSWSVNNKVAYKGKYETEPKESSYTTFKYYDIDARRFKTLETDESVTLKSTAYYAQTSILNTSNEYKLLFKNTGSGKDYWLASICIRTNRGYASFGLRDVRGTNVDFNDMCYSDGYATEVKRGIRPVVSLKSDIQIDTNAKDGKTPSTAYEIK